MKLRYAQVDTSSVKEHLDQVVDLMVDLFSKGYYLHQNLKVKQTRTYIRSLFKNGAKGILAKDGGKVRGFIILSPIQSRFFYPRSIGKIVDLKKTYALLEFGVSENFQRQGVGATLLEKAIASIDRSKYTHFMLQTLAHNKSAVRMYERFGFDQLHNVKITRLDRDRKYFFSEKIHMIKRI